MRGTMLWFNPVKDLGFISTDEGERLCVHGSGFAGGTMPERRCAGVQVSFRVSAPEGTRQAAEVVFVPAAQPRRARLRHAPRIRGGLG
jgi:cold shock CspA family protein